MIEVKKFKDIPWSEVVYDCSWYAIFKPTILQTEGHQIWVPKEDNMANVRETITAVYRHTSNIFLCNKSISYKIVMEFGEYSDSEISWPHIHVIPINEDQKKADLL